MIFFGRHFSWPGVILGGLGVRKWGQNGARIRFFDCVFFMTSCHRFLDDFWALRALKMLLPSRRNAVFYKIDVFEKTWKKYQIWSRFGRQNPWKIDRKSRPEICLYLDRHFSFFYDFWLILASKIGVQIIGFFRSYLIWAPMASPGVPKSPPSCNWEVFWSISMIFRSIFGCKFCF